MGPLYGLADYVLGSGNISEDARGRWYLNVTVEVAKPRLPASDVDAVGIDLGLKDLMASSNGDKVAAQQFYRNPEPQLAATQRRPGKKFVRALCMQKSPTAEKIICINYQRPS